MERELNLIPVEIIHTKPRGRKTAHEYKEVPEAKDICIDENGQYYKRYYINKRYGKQKILKTYPIYVPVDSDKVNFGKRNKNPIRSEMLTMIRRLNPSKQDLIDLKNFVHSIYDRKISELKNGRLQQPAS